MIIKRRYKEAVMATGMTELCEQVNPSLLREMKRTQTFPEIRRVQEIWVAAHEKRALLWLADRPPQWIGPDHLTTLGFETQIVAGVWYELTSRDMYVLLGLSCCFA